MQDVYYRHSTDGGRTWGKSLRVNDRIIDRRFGVFGSQDVNGPVGLVARDTVAYVSWDDTRNGTPENATSDIYFTRVRFGDASTVFGSSSTASAQRLWTLVGLGAGLALAGLALLFGMRLARRR